MNFTNSSLATYKRISKNKTTNRNHSIDTITIHCVVGQCTAKQGCDYFATTVMGCSANYVVGCDGSIGLSVEEKDRSWCSSNPDNDHRAVTIEVASDTTHPYAVTEAAYEALIKLVADICIRNNINELKWKADNSLIGQIDKQNMTVHRWFANKSCPGDYLYARHSDIAERVNKMISTNNAETSNNTSYPDVPFKVQVLITNLNYSSEPSMGGAVKGVTGKGVFTITEVSGEWGKLKSGAGWIYLANENYCKILGRVSQPVEEAKGETTYEKVPLEVTVSLSKHSCVILTLED